jgi:hypothetical protein
MFSAEDRLPHVVAMILARDEKSGRAALAKLLPVQRSDFARLFKARDGFRLDNLLVDLAELPYADPLTNENYPHELTQRFRFVPVGRDQFCADSVGEGYSETIRRRDALPVGFEHAGLLPEPGIHIGPEMNTRFAQNLNHRICCACTPCPAKIIVNLAKINGVSKT